MLQVLTAQILAGERERAIQRELKEQARRREAIDALADEKRLAANARDHAADERPCLDCPPRAIAPAR